MEPSQVRVRFLVAIDSGIYSHAGNASSHKAASRALVNHAVFCKIALIRVLFSDTSRQVILSKRRTSCSIHVYWREWRDSAYATHISLGLTTMWLRIHMQGKVFRSRRCCGYQIIAIVDKVEVPRSQMSRFNSKMCISLSTHYQDTLSSQSHNHRTVMSKYARSPPLESHLDEYERFCCVHNSGW